MLGSYPSVEHWTLCLISGFWENLPTKVIYLEWLMGPIFCAAKTGINLGRIYLSCEFIEMSLVSGDFSSDPLWPFKVGNQHGTLLKQADLYCTGPYWAEMWDISGENVGRIWGPYGEPTYETGGKKPYGPHMGCSYGANIVAQMGHMRGPCFCASWVHLKIVV